MRTISLDVLLFHHVRISVFLFGLTCLFATIVLRAQDPGAQQDAEAAREKILKASDQIDMIEGNFEATKTSLDNMKSDIAQLQAENSSLKQQLAAMQAAFEKAEAAHVTERQILLDEVSKMVASGKSSGTPKSPAKKKNLSATTANASAAPPPMKTSDGETAAVGTGDASSAEVTTPTPPAPPNGDGTETTPIPPKTQKGYYHIVESGETLTLICSAYRQQGINVTIIEIQKVNGLTDKSVLKVGQKLFIPKPET
jgi:regulator of replication initiation timing